MRRPSSRTGALVAGLPVIAVLIVGGVASAYWSGNGSGPGSASTGTTEPATIAPATASADLSPGGTSDVALRVTNPNTTSVRVRSLTLDTARGTGGFAVDGLHEDCTPLSVLSLADQDNGGAGWTVPARVGASDGVLPVTLADALGMSTAAANACQGASFTVYLTATP